MARLGTALAPREPPPSAKLLGPARPRQQPGPREPNLRLGFPAGLLALLLLAACGHPEEDGEVRAHLDRLAYVVLTFPQNEPVQLKDVWPGSWREVATYPPYTDYSEIRDLERGVPPRCGHPTHDHVWVPEHACLFVFRDGDARKWALWMDSGDDVTLRLCPSDKATLLEPRSTLYVHRWQEPGMEAAGLTLAPGVGEDGVRLQDRPPIPVGDNRACEMMHERLSRVTALEDQATLFQRLGIAGETPPALGTISCCGDCVKVETFFIAPGCGLELVYRVSPRSEGALRPTKATVKFYEGDGNAWCFSDSVPEAPAGSPPAGEPAPGS